MVIYYLKKDVVAALLIDSFLLRGTISSSGEHKLLGSAPVKQMPHVIYHLWEVFEGILNKVVN